MLNTSNPFVVNCHHSVYLNHVFNIILQVKGKAITLIGILMGCHNGLLHRLQSQEIAVKWTSGQKALLLRILIINAVDVSMMALFPVWDQGAAGSNPVFPTFSKVKRQKPAKSMICGLFYPLSVSTKYKGNQTES